VPEVLDLQLIRVHVVELDSVHSPVASKLDHRHDAMPGIVEEERAVAPDRLELVTLGQGGPAVELSEDVARKAHRAGEDPVGAARPDELLPVHPLRLAGKQTASPDPLPTHL